MFWCAAWAHVRSAPSHCRAPRGWARRHDQEPPARPVDVRETGRATNKPHPIRCASVPFATPWSARNPQYALRATSVIIHVDDLSVVVGGSSRRRSGPARLRPRARAPRAPGSRDPSGAETSGRPTHPQSLRRRTVGRARPQRALPQAFVAGAPRRPDRAVGIASTPTTPRPDAGCERDRAIVPGANSDFEVTPATNRLQQLDDTRLVCHVGRLAAHGDRERRIQDAGSSCFVRPRQSHVRRQPPGEATPGSAGRTTCRGRRRGSS